MLEFIKGISYIYLFIAVIFLFYFRGKKGLKYFYALSSVGYIFFDNLTIFGRYNIKVYPFLCILYFTINFRLLLKNTNGPIYVLSSIALYSLLVSLFSIDPYNSILSSINLFGSLLIIPITLLAINTKLTTHVFNFVIVTIIYNAFFVIAQLVYGIDFSLQALKNNNITSEGIRYFGTFNDPQLLGQFAAIAFYFINYIKSIKYINEYKYNTLLFITFILLFLSATKAAIIGLAIGILYIILFNFKLKYLRLIFGGVLILSLLVLLFSFYTLFNRFNDFENSKETRLLFWVTAIKISEKYPFGIGYGNYNLVIPKFDPTQVWYVNGEEVVISHPESGWLLFLVEFGYIILIINILYVIYIINPLFKNRKSNKHSDSIYILKAGILSSAISFMSLYSFTSVKYSCVLFIMLAFLISRIKEIKYEQNK